MAQQRSADAKERARLAVRLVRFGVVFLAGLFCIFLSLRPDATDSMGLQGSAAQRYLGPHGNAIGTGLVGLGIVLFSGWRLLRAARRLRQLNAASRLETS